MLVVADEVSWMYTIQNKQKDTDWLLSSYQLPPYIQYLLQDRPDILWILNDAM